MAEFVAPPSCFPLQLKFSVANELRQCGIHLAGRCEMIIAAVRASVDGYRAFASWIIIPDPCVDQSLLGQLNSEIKRFTCDTVCHRDKLTKMTGHAMY